MTREAPRNAALRLQRSAALRVPVWPPVLAADAVETRRSNVISTPPPRYPLAQTKGTAREDVLYSVLCVSNPRNSHFYKRSLSVAPSPFGPLRSVAGGAEDDFVMLLCMRTKKMD